MRLFYPLNKEHQIKHTEIQIDVTSTGSETRVMRLHSRKIKVSYSIDKGLKTF